MMSIKALQLTRRQRGRFGVLAFWRFGCANLITYVTRSLEDELSFGG